MLYLHPGDKHLSEAAGRHRRNRGGVSKVVNWRPFGGQSIRIHGIDAPWDFRAQERVGSEGGALTYGVLPTALMVPSGGSFPTRLRPAA